MRRTPSPVPGSDAWIAQRRNGIFATDAATVTGRNPFSSPFEKFQELQGTTMPKVATEAMEMGVILQPIVGKLWAKKHDRKIRANPWTYWLDEDIGSHFDFDVAPESGPVTEILEVKTADKFAARDWGEQDTDQVPEAYALQCQHEIMCRGPLIRRCYLAVLIGGNRYRDYVIERDDELIANILCIERKFLSDTRAGVSPPMDGSEAATAYLRSKSPRDNGERWELPESVEDIATSYLAASAAVVSAEQQKASAANRLRDAMSDHALAVGKLVKVSYKNNRDTDWTDWRAVALGAKAPNDLIARYTSTKAGNRPLIVTLLGDA